MSPQICFILNIQLSEGILGHQASAKIVSISEIDFVCAKILFNSSYQYQNE
jgi:hypothetical protein